MDRRTRQNGEREDRGVSEKNTFKIGDVVRLKSGGPLMTVDGLDPADETETLLTVVWYADGDLRWRDGIEPATLVRVEVRGYGPDGAAVVN
jgi:uncharacterized protein YodC (DUF2158 family)